MSELFGEVVGASLLSLREIHSVIRFRLLSRIRADFR